MRFKYTKGQLINVYNKVVENAVKSFDLGKYTKCLSQIETAAYMQYNLNVIYSDARLDVLLNRFSEYLGNNYKCSITSIPNRIILFDSFALDSKGLTQQYLDALVVAGYQILFVHETLFPEASVDIKEYLCHNNINIVELGHSDWKSKSKKLISIINDFNPSKVFFHLMPWSTLPLIVFSAYPNITKYQINLTDHAFWLGSELIDYSFEFRDYGSTISLEKRNLNKDQLLVLPYYPWQVDKPFEGFPVQTNNKIILFGGGALYKIYDESCTFFHMVRRILVENEDVIFFLAGSGNVNRLLNLISEYNLKDRFFLLGNRKDISQVFKHVDIYIDTYPIAGALMTQFAALSSIPILSLKTTETVEEVVCTKKYHHFVLDTVDAVVAEATKLIKDENYRMQQGKLFKSLIAGRDEFRQDFIKILESNHSTKDSQIIFIDYDNFPVTYIDNLNRGDLGCTIEFKIFRHSFTSLNVLMICNLVLNFPKKILNKIYRLFV